MEKISSIGLKGLEGYKIQVEVQVFSGSPSMVIVGLPDKSIKESRERILTVLRSVESTITTRKVIVNLSPAEHKKNGPLLDFAIAIGILKELKILNNEMEEGVAFLGAMSLDGTLLSTEDLLSTILAAKSLNYKKVYLPYDPNIPLEIIEGIELIFFKDIYTAIDYFQGKKIKNEILQQHNKYHPTHLTPHKSFSYIIGHEKAKRALEIAASGEHNVLLIGSPGCGKTLLAEAFPTILPPLSNKSLLEVMSLYQLAGERRTAHSTPPFRSPHHSSSSVSLIGGGSFPKPGEISLSHKGVLFLDEMAEFPKKSLEMLRQPLESGIVSISRVQSKVSYPSSFILIGATNPCPCGYHGSKHHYCICSPQQIKNYRNKISGPVNDRIDIFLHLHSSNQETMVQESEDSRMIRSRVEIARKRQYIRYKTEQTNGKVAIEELLATSPLTKNQEQWLVTLSLKHHWSNRVKLKIIRLARTISDLQNQAVITDEAIKEAISLRNGSLY
ncbi:YifB family Mg chelatase-like AAA ATPase [Bacillus sp. SD088]|uniref:YifB family Mg chelatase-like AAA ATPase n=1 Tax=Bacillus sp. SD088 TaxID=2782012 RepID=UPI001A956DEE|nr:YifB family Mg chelatase-like AAA ATPase [Bacillus sp. SD088]MBO0995672.1 YifB family Mg chelatase-like AAA ATPase [Bacillus sp. SD088]